jgi:hypothetical protein
VPGRFFQSLPVPCGVFWGWGKGEPSEARGGGANTSGEGPTGALCTGFTLGGVGWSGVAMGYPLVLFICVSLIVVFFIEVNLKLKLLINACNVDD